MSWIKSKVPIYSGSGGKGGGGGHTPVEDPDSLRSVSFAKVLDVLCEGEIEGLVDGAKSIFIDNIPLENADSTTNFQGFSYTFREGSQGQGAINGFDATENAVTVGVKVVKPTPISRVITDLSIEAVRVTLDIPGLSLIKDNGDITGSTLEYKINVITGFTNLGDISSGSPITYTAVEDTISGKTSSKYQRSKVIQLSSYGPGPWAIQVVRVTVDSDSSKLSNQMYWSSYTELVYEKFAYPLTAIAGLSIDSRYFNNIPTRSYDVKLLRVKVPRNYDPISRFYSGYWDGSFKIAWTDNPAWCLYDLLTNSRYGLADKFFQEDSVDKWALYKIAKYCDELVPSGVSGGELEPRFTCNLYLQTRADAYNVINDLTSIFRGISYWTGDTLATIQDSPAEPVSQFTSANVIEGSFTYAGAGLKARHTAALVSWIDPTMAYTRQVEYVEDTEQIKKLGYRPTEMTAIGCTSRGQAHRIGLWTLLTEKFETQVITFSTGLEAAGLFPGAIIQIQDEHRSGDRFSGRIYSASGTQVVLDSLPSAYSPNSSYTLYVQTTAATSTTIDGHTSSKPIGKLESRKVTAYNSNVLTIASPFDNTPEVNAVWILESTNNLTQLARVISIAETEPAIYAITAVEHEPNKYEAIDYGVKLEERNTQIVSSKPKSPQDLTVAESIYIDLVGTKSRINIDWLATSSSTRYVIESSKDLGDWVIHESSFDGSNYLLDNVVIDSTYRIRVKSLGIFGLETSEYVYATITILGKLVPPADVTNFEISRGKENLTLTWSHVPDLDKSGYEIRRTNIDIDPSDSLDDVWDGLPIFVGASDLSANGIVVTNVSNNTYITDLIDGGTYSYLIKAIDTSGLYSVSPALVKLSIRAPKRVSGFALIQNRRRLEMVWKPNSEIGIVGYEIREGPDWSRSTKVAEITATRHSLSYGSYGKQRIFWIKAIVSPGIYSKLAAKADTSVIQISDFNAIYQHTENGPSNWTGTYPASHWTINPNNDNLVSDKRLTYTEYSFDITLPQKYVAQTTIAAEYDMYAADYDFWGAIEYSWDSDSAKRTWRSLPEGTSLASIEYQIATKLTEGLMAHQIDIWEFNSSLTSFLGTNPSLSKNVSVFEAAGRHFPTALKLGAGGLLSKLSYNKSIPSLFSIGYWIDSDIKEDGLYELIFLLNTTTGDSLSLRYNARDRNLILVDNSGTQLISEEFYFVPPPALLDGRLFTADVWDDWDYPSGEYYPIPEPIFVAMSQSSDTRSLYASTLSNGSSVFSTINTGPVTSGYNYIKVA